MTDLRKKPASESDPDTWLVDGSLVYRLTEGVRPVNRDEILVQQVGGSRQDRDALHAGARRVAELLNAAQVAQLAMLAAPASQLAMLAAPASQPVAANRVINFQTIAEMHGRRENGIWKFDDIALRIFAGKVAGLVASQPVAESPRVEFLLRRLLAHHVSGAAGYYDDGELQDNTQPPFIDFLRDHPKDIELKLGERDKRPAPQSATEKTQEGWCRGCTPEDCPGCCPAASQSVAGPAVDRSAVLDLFDAWADATLPSSHVDSAEVARVTGQLVAALRPESQPVAAEDTLATCVVLATRTAMYRIADGRPADAVEPLRRLREIAIQCQKASQPVAEYETREDGQTVRVDRWQVGIRRIVALLWGNRKAFEVDEVVEAVRALLPASNDDDEDLVLQTLGLPASPVTPSAEGVKPGFVQVPKLITAAMRDVLDTEDWTWADLLAAAEAITLAEHEELSRRDALETAAERDA